MYGLINTVSVRIHGRFNRLPSVRRVLGSSIAPRKN